MKYLLFSIFAVLLIGIQVPVSFAVEYAQVLTTDGGTLDIGIYTMPEVPNTEETTKIEIHFLQLNSEAKQEHIDYWTSVSKDGNYISEPSSVKHTNPGTVTVSVVFPEDGSYNIDVGVEGILFQVIPVEIASFTVDIGQPTQTEASEIPAWIKNNAGWWATDQIDDSSFLQGIQYLIKEGIMVIPPTETLEPSGSQEVPEWVKNTAGWWANDEIDDDTFVNAITYLIQQGLIQV
uniref:Blue (Type1) copper domain-containing protein n=1 Tax=uncultured marine thaumarchaeote AD1000_25_B10 TaxID=1455903 RepID=A0A075FM68_9ARCH|nr:hypothetical protein [uncultured marine thaumarchaeote AD1000_25_B10]